MDVFPADAARVALTCPVAGDAMADAVEEAETLDIQMNEAAGLGIFIAHDRFDRRQVLDPRQARAFENAADGGRRHASFRGYMLPGSALPAQRDDPLDPSVLG